MPLVIVGAIGVAYAGTFAVPLLLDDSIAIVENPSLRGPWNLARALAPSAESTTAGRPLLNLTFSLNYAISGVEPWSYHVVNLLVHVLAALTLFGLVRRTLQLPLLRARWGRSSLGFAGVVALLWGLHPVQTQSVTYLSQRAESLMGLFYLATLYCFVRGLGRRTWLWHSLAVGSCGLGALSKEVIVTAPLIVLLYDRTFVAGTFAAAFRARRAFYMAISGSWLVLGWMLADVHVRGVGFGQGVGAFDYALTQCEAMAVYLRLGLWPHPLIFDRGTALVTSVAEIWAPIVLLVGLLVLLGWAWVRRPWLGFLLAWFGVILAPTSSLVPVAGATVAENRVYLPLAAIVVLVLLALQRCVGPRWALGAGGMLALGLAVATVGRNQDYGSAVRIWTDTVAKAPAGARAHNNLALLLAESVDRRGEARAHYLEALRLKPDFAEAHNNLALLLAATPGRQAEALAHYAEALRLKPGYAAAHNNRAALLAATPGGQAEALADYMAAVRLRPDFAEAHNNLAALLAAIPARAEEALIHYATALRLKPDYAEAHYNLANLLASMSGRQQEALTHYRAALRSTPDDPEVHNNLANLLATIPGRTDEALAHYAQALRLRPDFLAAHFNLAALLAAIPERRAEAEAHYRKVITLDPSSAAAREALQRVGK